jgi:hypothetical protein
MRSAATRELFNRGYFYGSEPFVSAPLLRSESSLRIWRGHSQDQTRMATVSLFSVISFDQEQFGPPQQSKQGLGQEGGWEGGKV